MKEMIVKLTQFKDEVQKYQKEAFLRFDAIEVKLLQELVAALTVVDGKYQDWEISYGEISRIRSCCCPYQYPELSALALEQIRPYCDVVLNARKVLAKNALDFIHDVKAIKNHSHLNIASYQPQYLIPFLEQLFKSSNVMHVVKNTTFDQLFATLKGSHIFSESDLRIWSISNLSHNEKLFKGMLEAHKMIERKRYQAATMDIDPLIIERFRRNMLYKDARAESTVVTSKEEPQDSESFQMENLVCNLQSTVIHHKPLK